MKEFLKNFITHSGQDGTIHTLHPGPVVTISRECGCSAKRIATKLSKILTGYNYLSETKTDVEWKWVSREIIEKAAGELEMNPATDGDVSGGEAKHHLDEVTEAFSTSKVYKAGDQQTIDTVRKVVRSIAEEGHFIIVGLGANIIAQDIPQRLSVKLQAPLDWRINRIMQISNLSYADAQEYVLEVDSQRDSFLEHVAGRKLDNNDFDLVFNYSTMLDDHIVDVMVNVLKNKRIITNSEED